MPTTQEELLEAAIARQALLNVSVAQVEKEWKDLRAQSRENTIHLITECGMSVAGANRITGHHRATIKVWLDVHNAEKKAALRAAAAGGAQDKK
jgi:hypothetical protein